MADSGMLYRKLGTTDMVVSSVSFGASSLGSVFHDTKESESIQVVHRALDLGINYIDTAPWYGHRKAESVLGKALQGIPREKYFLATKVGRYDPDPLHRFDFSAEKTLASVDESLSRMGVDYVDVIQVHDMEFAPNLDIIVNETLPALQKVKDSGKARYIGITGYPLENFRTILERTRVPVDTVLTYCRYSINDTSLNEYLEYFKSKGVGLINASPLSMGLLTNRGPADWHPATPNIRQACKQAAQYCQERNVDISRLAMYFSHSCKDVHTTLFSTSSLENLKKSIQSAVQPLTTNEEEVLKNIMKIYFEPLKIHHWEGVEVAQYWESVKQAT